eukprot:6939466-Lingulodinium_polyedra.AAC.1
MVTSSPANARLRSSKAAGGNDLIAAGVQGLVLYEALESGLAVTMAWSDKCRIHLNRVDHL